ncbi:Pimeloyl-ACP methyl ester carboxylesterase [Hymenobacter gelipurpurascens]|uniref:Pimeloyl-ACP methyl ester carboxylesterase n=1 Tax=Hymenobacter gelipurpurascens TaxID=89968 RepID=A0A212T4Y8_9BACT|nr:alpha/beta hydrolase [Hymenobacter gelipurpurascens]SNC60896.1 Pimeloyl-ACP methyl ester carboxylesterase [Hymenobacter gelipurpurascens]
MKPPILLLHGALATEAQLKPLARELSAFFAVHTFTFSGHGGRPLGPAGPTMQHCAAEVIWFLDAHGLAAVHVFGYSMGGYAALAAALKAPERFRSITTLGTKFNWTPTTASSETHMLNLEVMQDKIPQYVQQLEQLHAPTPVADVLSNTAQLLRGLGDSPVLTPEKLSELEVPVQVLVGELDKVAGVDPSRHYTDFMPRALFEIIMNTSHPLEKVNPDLLFSRILRFVEMVEENMI